MSELDDLADREQAIWDRWRTFIAEYRKDLGLVARQGDGRCGALIGVLMDELDEFIDQPIERPNAKRRLPQKLKRQVWERDDYTCICCWTHDDLTVDHIIPESLGGTDNMANLQTLCRSCNSRKGAKL